MIRTGSGDRLFPPGRRRQGNNGAGSGIGQERAGDHEPIAPNHHHSGAHESLPDCRPQKRPTGRPGDHAGATAETEHDSFLLRGPSTEHFAPRLGWFTSADPLQVHVEPPHIPSPDAAAMVVCTQPKPEVLPLSPGSQVVAAGMAGTSKVRYLVAGHPGAGQGFVEELVLVRQVIGVWGGSPRQDRPRKIRTALDREGVGR